MLLKPAIRTSAMTALALRTPPDLTTGCQDNVFQNGDLDFDGSPYWTEWPTGTTPNTYPSSFVEQFPTTDGRQYPQYFFQTDLALSEIRRRQRSRGRNFERLHGAASGPGSFYPYWTELHAGAYCALEFGNVSGRASFPRLISVRTRSTDRPVHHARLPRVHRRDAPEHLPEVIVQGGERTI